MWSTRRANRTFRDGRHVCSLEFDFWFHVGRQNPVLAANVNGRDGRMMAHLFCHVVKRRLAFALELVGFAEQRVERLGHAFEMRGEIGDDERGE